MLWLLSRFRFPHPHYISCLSSPHMCCSPQSPKADRVLAEAPANSVAPLWRRWWWWGFLSYRGFTFTYAGLKSQLIIHRQPTHLKMRARINEGRDNCLQSIIRDYFIINMYLSWERCNNAEKQQLMLSRCKGQIVWLYLIDDYVIATEMRLGLGKKKIHPKKRINHYRLSWQIVNWNLFLQKIFLDLTAWWNASKPLKCLGNKHLINLMS